MAVIWDKYLFHNERLLSKIIRKNNNLKKNPFSSELQISQKYEGRKNLRKNLCSPLITQYKVAKYRKL